MQEIIKIKAIGQSASIGSFYDATTNNFDSMSIFKSDISGLITTIDDPTTVYEFDRTNSFSEKFKKFDINGSLKLKLLAGLVELEGAGNYLKEDQSDNGSQKISLIYRCRTKKDSLNINDSGLINLFALDNFHNFTHFVTSIKWGADVVITFEEKKYLSNTTTNAGLLGRTEVSIDKIMKMLGIEVPFFDNIIGKIGSNGEVKFTGQDKKFDENLNVKINADIPGLDIIPTSMKELFEFIKNIHSKLKNCNNGKGKPIEYELTPLCTIKQMFKLDSIQLSHFYNDLDNSSIDEIISDFDKFLNEKQKFNF
ncbi:neoverrucotoxin subunit beta-like, partial [Brachionus plicatilis]